MRMVLALSLLALPCLAAGADEPAKDDIAGIWLSAPGEDGRAQIEVFKKEDGDYSGKIIWLNEPNYPEDHAEAGQPRHDLNNPDEDKRDRPILGLEILSGFEKTGDNKWAKGSIYDPSNGKTYKCKMWLEEGGKELHLRGYVGISLFGRTTVWERLSTEEAKKMREEAEGEKP